MKKVLLILGELDNSDIDWIVANSRKDKIPAGTVLIHEGQPISTLYILLEGELSVTTKVMGDREIANLTNGEVVGEMSFIDTHPPSATVTAKQDALVVAIPRESLATKLQEDLGFACRFYRALAMVLSSRLRTTVNQLSGTVPSSPLSQAQDDNHLALAQTRLDGFLQRLKGE
ncbi:MAG: cyclic nucleotide-binding domain-containing protein [Leptolyngbyaceae cyanobacterium HOT.MB2.61]|jgi:CRP/FNR family cyclic AMP-dependent transcriptional regulator|nr:cyclic nucleotide-binding domain-containing protein [Leptolyngbyaceae cyanobacterium HOT.MB2.61]